MKNADKFVVGGLVYDVLSPATFGDYMETIGSACINPDGYAENKLFLAYDDNVQKLFRATTAIANSELLIKDTNCEPTTMAEALANALSAGGVSYDNTDSGLTASNVQDAIDEVNGDLETVNNDLTNEVSARAELGAHQFAKYSLESCKRNNTAGTWNNNVYTYNGGTVSYNDDGSFTINGTFSAGFSFYPYKRDDNTDPYRIPNGKYILSGGTSKVQINSYCTRNNAYYEYAFVYAGEAVFEVLSTDGNSGLTIIIAMGTYDNVTVKPLIRLISDPSKAFTPYAMTNRELTEARFLNGTLGTVATNNFTDKAEYTIPNDGWYYLNLQTNVAASGSTLRIMLGSDYSANSVAQHRNSNIQYEATHANLPLKKGTKVVFKCTDASVSCQYQVTPIT